MTPAWGPIAVMLAVGLGRSGDVGVGAGDFSRERPVERIVLPNGMTVLLAADHKAPLVGMELRYRVGARDEPENRLGITALTQRLMMRATTHLREGDYDRYLDAAGAYDSTWSLNSDHTIFRVTVPSDQLALPLWLWSDQMGFFAERLDDRLIAQQLVVLNNQHVTLAENAPASIVNLLVEDELYPPGHPYRNGLPHSIDGLQGLGVRELRAFVEAQYTPDRAILSLTGDFEVARAKALVEQYFGRLSGAHAPARRAAARPSLVGETRVQVSARVELASVTMTWPTVGLYEPGDAELDLIAELLVGSRAGWLRWKLIDELKIAATVQAHQRSSDLSSEFVIRASAMRGHTARELADAIDGVLRRLQAGPPDEQSFRGAVAGYLFDKVLAIEENGAAARQYANCEEHGIRSGCFAFWLSRYTRVAPASLSAFAVMQLPLGRRVVVDVTPGADAPIAGQRIGRSIVPE